MKDVFTITATLHKSGNFYHHFGIHPVTCSVYGDKPSDIVDITFKISEDQHIPGFEEEKNCNDPKYWGWYDLKNNEWTSMIYGARFLLDMCFPVGIVKTESFGDGKAYHLEICQ